MLNPGPALCLGALALALGAGCSLNKMTGDMMSSYAVEHLGPYMVSLDDLSMACETGVSMGAYLLSFERVTDAPDRAAIATLAAAASCAEEQAWEHELRHLRALKEGRIGEAQDARIAQQRAHALTARRYYQAFLRLERAFADRGDACPDLDDVNDQLIWLLGNVSVVQAVQHDRAAGGVVGVPMDAPRRAERAIVCLNDADWFGVPNALSAAVWVGVPGATPEGQDPWARLEEAAARGEAAGMRMGRAIQAQAAASAGDAELVRRAITALAASTAKTEAPAPWRLLDQTAIRQIEALSDRLWTEATGHRTPIQSLGTFPSEAPTDVAPESDDLLDGLGDES